MFDKILQIFKVRDIRNKILFILFILVVFRLSANIPIPGVDPNQLKSFFEGNQLFGLLDMFSGGGLTNISIMMLGVGPYITASIIMQLMTMIFPQLEQVYKEEGEAGRQKFNMWTRWLTVPLAALQGFAMVSLLKAQGLMGAMSILDYLTIIITATAGTIFLMWLGELITEKGLGNGVSLIIFAGIVSGLPVTIKQIIATWDPTKVLVYVGFGVMSVMTIAAVVFITEGQRNIPVSFAKRIRGGSKTQGGGTSYLPLRVNQAGVIPIIFAMSIMLFPGVIANFFAGSANEKIANLAGTVADFFANQAIYAGFYFILVVLFTYFYTAVTFDPKNISESLQRQGSFIPGIRPGIPTMEYLNFIVNRITLTGALFLGLVAVLPFIVQGITGIQTLTIGGTGILIVVSVVIETIKQIEAQLVMRDYDKL
ncbi:MAG: preprotein translocase subunit SecY [Candidatus Moranbacteria bacterium]|jgi:preprotein translocase subunit SecY|nr:preprotein translocase subunit SecY [Candidatus Moranbacteria bacterium]